MYHYIVLWRQAGPAAPLSSFYRYPKGAMKVSELQGTLVPLARQPEVYPLMYLIYNPDRDTYSKRKAEIDTVLYGDK